MDKLKAERTVIHSAFSRQCKQLEVLMAAELYDDNEVKAQFSLIEDKIQRLKKLDHYIFNLLLDTAYETDLTKELTVQGEYQEWSKFGIIEEVPPDDVNNFEHYLPHRPVTKPKGSTKVRPVFDASARKKSTPSLNQYLNCGPNLVEFIPSLLRRLSECKYGVSSDIEKAFLQISVQKSDGDYLRFFMVDKK
ncbi:hypothetical protein AVEN_47586-1 [Araneus ventricosus]|uniref:Reverse transcriptase domain-containing protein n=1 Tax=Araneus ventricosus TaxID=182803 RepID=A0A4Y2DKA4_ARAVE|nr:hypothetical protein AVEN_47586-1 [Araneus ventricosus]